jgi:hypothetical protein
VLLVHCWPHMALQLDLKSLLPVPGGPAVCSANASCNAALVPPVFISNGFNAVPRNMYFDPYLVWTETRSFCLESPTPVRLQSTPSGFSDLFVQSVLIVSVDHRAPSLYYFRTSPDAIANVTRVFGLVPVYWGGNAGPSISLGLLAKGNHAITVSFASVGATQNTIIGSPIWLVPAVITTTATTTTAHVTTTTSKASTTSTTTTTTTPSSSIISITIDITATSVIITITFSGPVSQDQLSQILIQIINLTGFENISVIVKGAFRKRFLLSDVKLSLDGAGAGAAANLIVDTLSNDPAFSLRIDSSLPLVVGILASLPTNDTGSMAPVFLVTDLNFDTKVNLLDIAVAIQNWGPCAMSDALCLGDVNRDGVVNLLDLVLIIDSWTGNK